MLLLLKQAVQSGCGSRTLSWTTGGGLDLMPSSSPFQPQPFWVSLFSLLLKGFISVPAYTNLKYELTQACYFFLILLEFKKLDPFLTVLKYKQDGILKPQWQKRHV